MALSRPNLPSYSDDEVKDFHPAFEYAANNALKLVTGGCDIKVVHHRLINGITVDFAFERKSTGKIILLAEIKRTASDTQSTRTRNQARTYFLEAKPHTEAPYYLTSNLEIIDLFKNDNARPQVSSQIIKGSPLQSGTLTGDLSTSDENDFYTNLENNIAKALTHALSNIGDYEESFISLQVNLKDALLDPDKWHQLFMPVAFEYIRGASKKTKALESLIKSVGWKPADVYKGTPQKLIDLGEQVDFYQIFKDPAPLPNDSKSFHNKTIADAYNAGLNRVTGDDLAEIVNELLAPTGLGIVETDDELARLLSIVAKDIFIGEIGDDDVICDPAAGSGKLLIAASQIFTGLKSSQYWANEVNPLFAESLSLRLGLNHAASISPTEHPKVSIGNVANLSKDDFEKVMVLLLNPPFISGVKDTELKNKIANRIKAISGKNSITNNGQIGLEAVFLELVWHLIPDGTVITAIMPHSYTSRLSAEVVAFRRFLINQLKLTHIVTYPRNGLFEKVSKQTVIFAGIKDTNPERNIKIIDIQVPLTNIDYTLLSSGLKSGSLSPTRGVDVTELTAKSMLVNLEWGAFIGNKAKTSELMGTLFVNFKKFDNLGAGLRRGTAGNNGCADLAIYSKSDIVGKLIGSVAPQSSWIKPGINNSKIFEKILDVATAPELALVPPAKAYQAGTAENLTLSQIIKLYISKEAKLAPTAKPQKKNVKDISGVTKSLKSNQKLFQTYQVLIPRGSRKFGRIGVAITPIVISTNFVIAKFNSEQEAKLVASWLYSVFGQIQMELNCSNQEGMRKLEKEPISKIMYPDISLIPLATQNALIAAYIADDPLQFKSPKPRAVDTLWAQYIAASVHADVIVKTFNLFRGMCEDRNP